MWNKLAFSEFPLERMTNCPTTNLGNDLEKLWVGLPDLLQHGGQHVGVLLDHGANLLKHLVVPETKDLRAYNIKNMHGSISHQLSDVFKLWHLLRYNSELISCKFL